MGMGRQILKTDLNWHVCMSCSHVPHTSPHTYSSVQDLATGTSITIYTSFKGHGGGGGGGGRG